MDPRTRALRACLEASLSDGRLGLGLREYERRTGTSARMLVHHFGNKEGLDAALIEEVAAQLRQGVEEAFAGQRTAIDILGSFRTPENAHLLRLLRLLLERALSGNEQASMVLRQERQRWRGALRGKVEDSEIEPALFILEGGALDAILADLQS